MKCPVWSNGGNCDFRPHIDHQNQIEGEILDVLFCLKKMIGSEDGEKAKPKKNIGKLLHSLIKFIIFVGGKTHHALSA